MDNQPRPRVIGVDLAVHQGPNVDFDSMAREGIAFVIAKATQGETITDATYARNAAEGARTMEFGGGYTWFEPRHHPIRSAQRFADVVGKSLDRFRSPIVMFDFEDDDRADPRGPVRGESLVANAEATVLEIERLLGLEMLIYSGKWFWREAVGSTPAKILTARRLCHAQYPRAVCPGGKRSAEYLATLRALGTPDLPDGWTHADFRQFDGTGGLLLPQGIDSDFDEFEGTVDGLRRVCASMRRVHPTDPAPPPEPGLQLGDGRAPHDHFLVDRLERDEVPDTIPGTPRSKGSSQGLRAVDAPILDANGRPIGQS